MGGKNRKKGSGSETSGPSAGSSGGGQRSSQAQRPQQQAPQQQAPQQQRQGTGAGAIRQRLSQMNLDSAGQQQQQNRPPQSQQQQSRPQQQQQSQQNPWGNRGQGQQSQQQQNAPQQQQNPWGNRGQGQQSQQQAPARGQQPPPQRQQERPQQAQSGQQTTLPRSESTQSVRSQSSQHSGGSKSAAKPQGGQDREREREKLSQAASKLPGLSVEYKGQGTLKNAKSLGSIETNYLKIVLAKMVDNAYHYDVKFEPDRPKKLLTMVFLEFVRVNFPQASVAFDGTNNAYASARLQIGDLKREIKIIHPETGRELTFLVSIQEANDSEIPIKRALTSYKDTHMVDDPKRAMQAVEVILKAAFHQPHLRNGIQGGRSFFLLPGGRREYLGDFYELWLGLFQSMVLGQIPLLNVDVNHKAFPKRYNTLIDMLPDMQNDLRCQIDPNRGLDRDVEEALRRHLSGLEICYTNPGTNDKRLYKFMAIDQIPERIQFTLDNGERTNVLQYFRSSGRQIRYPALPCIKLGNSIKNQSVPMEFCSIPDKQVINKKCTENQTRNIIRFAATSTDIRREKIMNLIQQIRHNQSATIQGFGLEIGANFMTVPARQLNAPQIQYGNGKLNPSRGVWRGEGMQFLMPENAKTWGILNTNFRTQPRELNEFAQALYRCSGPTGLQLAPQPIFQQTVNDRNQMGLVNKIRNELERIGKNKEVDILFCVIPDSGPTYAKIKQLAEIDFGVLTQCIKAGTVYRKRTDGSTISNILLKVNTKLNGTNHKLVQNPILSGKKVMLIGADVTHPSPEQNNIPSVVGVAASYDEHAFRYNMCWRLQGQRKEMIEDFQTIMKEHLEYFKKENGCLPEKILYYRDGVSEGQFDQVMRIERNDMMLACRAMKPGYEKTVKMTIVVVQKRHHTRFFPGNTGVGKDDRKNNNVPAGTIVDTHITRPNENHFYLVSHQSIQGVAKPTKYCILLDEGNHNIDDLQALTYNLCHLFSRCNRSVSYPAPTYYAHLAAYRGRVYIENERLNMSNLQREWSTRTIKENIIKGHPMYFV